MKTLSESLDWIKKQVGKSLDFDGMYGAQCADLPRFYVQFLGEAQYGRTPSAKNLWTTEWPGAFHKSDKPEVGAIAVFDATPTNVDGHCSLVTRVDGPAKFQSMDQNWVNSTANGSPAAYVEHDLNSRVLGFIVPDFSPEPAAPAAPAAGGGKSNEEIANEVIRGDWGNGDDRKQKLAAAGYDYDTVQGIVNHITAGVPTPPTPPAPEEVWANTEQYPQPNSTLWGIAQTYLGDGAAWESIWNNPRNAHLKDLRGVPEHIQPGDLWFIK